jgi:hypothetical protein
LVEQLPTYAPTLRAIELGDGRVRLTLGELGSGDGETLQDAADDLVRRLLAMAMAFRTSGLGRLYSAFRPDPSVLSFLWELGEIAAAGGDIRERIF